KSLVTGLDAEFRGVPETFDQVLDLVVVECAGSEPIRLVAGTDVARADGHAMLHQFPFDARAAMLQLEAGDGARGADRPHQMDVPVQVSRRFKAELPMFGTAGGAMHAAEFHDHHADAAFGARAVEGDLPRRDLPFVAAEIG